MASKWNLYIFFLVLLTIHFVLPFVIVQDKPDCFELPDNDPLLIPTVKCSWLLKAKRDLIKYRSFFADLLQEENKDFALELQEIYNLLCEARDESDERQKEHLLKYAKWLMESTKKLNVFLLKRGIWKI